MDVFINILHGGLERFSKLSLGPCDYLPGTGPIYRWSDSRFRLAGSHTQILRSPGEKTDFL